MRNIKILIALIGISLTGCATGGAGNANLYHAMAAMRGLATPDKPIYWNPGAPMRPQVNYITPAAQPVCAPNNPYCGDPQNVSW